jgi:hypothetical protein
MVALLLYCWSRGVRSARRIERACVEDVACRVIAAQQRPDHATIARFVVRHERALGELFGEVLVLCADAGLATVGVLAIDGTKVAANASRDRTMNYEQVAKAIVEEQIATDIAETEQFGQRRGDELPDVIATTKGREGWLRAARQRMDQERAERAEPIPRSGAQRLLEAKRRLEEDLAAEREINAKYEAYRARDRMRDGRRMSARPKPYTPPETPQGKINVTDPDSKLVKSMRGWIQGLQRQGACNEHHNLRKLHQHFTAPPRLRGADSRLGRQDRISTYPSVPCTRIRCPSRISRVACSTPTTAGKPYSRAITAPWVIKPPTSVTRPVIATNRGDQLGSV